MWLINEDKDVLECKRMYKEHFMVVTLDYGPSRTRIFKGSITDNKNEILGFCEADSFHGCFEKLINLTYEKRI